MQEINTLSSAEKRPNPNQRIYIYVCVYAHNTVWSVLTLIYRENPPVNVNFLSRLALGAGEVGDDVTDDDDGDEEVDGW